MWRPHSVIEVTPVNFKDSQPHSWNTRAVWTEQNGTTSCLSRHTAQEREPLSLLCVSGFHLFTVTYSDGEMSCMSSEHCRSRHFSTRAAPISFMFCTWLKYSALHTNLQAAIRLMKIWWMNLQLDWTLVVSESDAFWAWHHLWFDWWLLVRNTGLPSIARS